jgi:hypothetical protein
MDAESEKTIMTAEAASRVPKDQHGKKSSGKPAKKPQHNDSLYAISEHTLSGFLDEEPDIYSVADLKVRYK